MKELHRKKYTTLGTGHQENCLMMEESSDQIPNSLMKVLETLPVKSISMICVAIIALVVTAYKAWGVNQNSEEIEEQKLLINSQKDEILKSQKMIEEKDTRISSLEKEIEELQVTIYGQSTQEASKPKREETKEGLELETALREKEEELRQARKMIKEKDANISSLKAEILKLKANKENLSEIFKSCPPGEPTLITCTPPYTSLTISLPPLEPQLEQYVSGYEISYITDQGTSPTTILINNDKARSFTVQDLEPDTVYHLTIVCIFNGDIKSQVSHKTSVLTSSPEQLEQKPEKTTHNSISLRWLKSAETLVLKHYMIQYKSLKDETWSKVPAESGLNEGFKIKGLQPYEEYLVCVSSEYEDGVRSGNSEIVTMFTRPTSPPRQPHYERGVYTWLPPSYRGESVTIDRYIITELDRDGSHLVERSVPGKQNSYSTTSGFFQRFKQLLSPVNPVKVRAVCGSGDPEVRYHSLESKKSIHT